MKIFIESIKGLIVIAVLALSACESKDGEFNGATAEELSDLYAYRDPSAFADTLVECVSAQEESHACTLKALPLIGMQTDSPSVANVMERVAVSHDWMGERIEEVLSVLPEEILLLTRGLTAIVIDDDIRPAYYTPLTGAIYIDPNYLWLTPQEAATVNSKKDFRSGFSRPLAFRSLSRYVKDDSIAYRYQPPEDATDRSLEDIEFLIASLLIHELAHANDYFPPALHAQLDENLRPWPAANEIRSAWVSTSLVDSQALNAPTLFELAGVMFHGENASDQLKQVSALEVGSAFSPDGASDMYAYSSIREDTAMLFEEAMMYYLFGIERDIAFTPAPPEGANSCEDYPVSWGVRMRFATSQVAPRAEFAVSQILPEVDTQTLFSNLPNTRSLPEETNWCDSILFESTTLASQNTFGAMPLEQHLQKVDQKRLHYALPYPP